MRTVHFKPGNKLPWSNGFPQDEYTIDIINVFFGSEEFLFILRFYRGDLFPDNTDGLW